MNGMNRKWILTALLLCAVSAIAAAPSAAAPQALLNAKPASAVLTGNSGGAFAFYTVEYPGDESVATIELRYAPADPVTNAGVGFNVYSSDGSLVGQGQPVADTGGYGVLRLEYSSTTRTTLTVQVYNYIPDYGIPFSVVVEGLPEAAAETAAAPAAVVTETATAKAKPVTGSGYLAGNGGGSYAFYEVQVLADAPGVAVTLNWSPDNPIIATGVGFVVYGPSGEVIRGTGTGTPGERSATLSADAPGAYQVQVYNYIEGLTIQYTLQTAESD